MNETKILKCSKCRKFVDVPESYMKKVCPLCLDKLRRQYQKTKEFKPSKLDIAERDRIEGERQQELSEKYGTSKSDCVKFRILETKKDHDAFWFNHLGCAECQKWRKDQGFNLNASEKKFAEHQGWLEMFKDSNVEPLNMGEDKKGWNSICSFCGAKLIDGKCPNECTGF